MGPCVRRDDVEIAGRHMTDFAAPTIEAARRALAARLKTAAIESAELDARILTGHALGLDLTGLISAAQRQLTPDESARLEEFARRRLAGEPVARILGEKEFWGLPLQLSSATLVPRPDTETVVELALELLRAGGSLDRPLRIADLGTGSGAILLALLSELPAAQGFRDRHFAKRALQIAARQCGARWPLGARDVHRLRLCERANRPVRSDRFESALYPHG